MPDQQGTLADRWLTRLKNNPVVAAVMVLGIVITAVAGMWQSLPEDWRGWITSTKSSATTTTSIGAENGWLFAGYLDGQTGRLWASTPHVRVVRASGAPDRRYPLRVGDVVSPTSPRPQVIVDFRRSGSANVLTPPVELTEVIRKSEDYTGRVLQPGELFEVAHVDVTGLPDSDLSVWLRLIPYVEPVEQ